jgi:hypothetical protein
MPRPLSWMAFGSTLSAPSSLGGKIGSHPSIV